MKPITVGELINALKRFPKDLPLVSSSDEEGNNYSYVYYSAQKGLFNENGFISISELNKIKTTPPKDELDKKVTAQILEEFSSGEDVICIN